MSAQLWRPRNRHDFKVAIICALALEADMVRNVFDEEYGHISKNIQGDNNEYTFGLIGRHNVVLARMPSIGNTYAATVSTNLRRSFSSIRIAFVVGICGAYPMNNNTKAEIVLGDCIVSTLLVQYDFGRQHPKHFLPKIGLEAIVNKPCVEIQDFLARLQIEPATQRLRNDLILYLALLRQKEPKALYPGSSKDRLFRADYVHTHRPNELHCHECDQESGVCHKNCDAIGCEESQLVQRTRLKFKDSDLEPLIHFGIYGSANHVMRSGLHRDQLFKHHNFIAFEMEGAGVKASMPAIAVKSACDYADSHKSKEWQCYAAATSAAGLKAVLKELDPVEVEALPKDLVSTYMIPLLKNSDFVGRQDELLELEQRLIDTDVRYFAVYGLGGVGKTQLALSFCYNIQAKYPDYSIFWASAVSLGKFKLDLGKIVKRLSLPIDPAGDNVVLAVQEYLSSEKAGKWLLVVDNADQEDILFTEEADGISDVLPKSELGVILFTTRYRKNAVNLAEKNFLHLREMTKAEANLFLVNKLGKEMVPQDDGATNELLEVLTFLPLAIVQAAAYILQNDGSVEKYLGIMKATDNEAIDLLSRGFQDRNRGPASRNPVALTFLVSFNQILAQNGTAANLLYILAFLEAKGIPISILEAAEHTSDVVRDVDVLVGYSFLYKTGIKDIYDMHRLVRYATKAWMDREKLVEPWAQKVLLHLVKVFSENSWENRTIWRQYIPHSLHALHETQNMSSKERADLCISVGRVLLTDGRAKEALKCCVESHEWFAQYFPESEPQYLESQRLMGQAYDMNGEQQKAIRIFEKQVVLRKEMLTEDHKDLLVARHMMAWALTRSGRVKEAIEMFEKVVEAGERTLQADDYALLNFQLGLSLAYVNDRQIKPAIKILENIIEIGSKNLVEDHPNILLQRQVLAWSYGWDGRMEEAITLGEDVLRLKKNSFSDNHPALNLSKTLLARTLRQHGQTERAIELLEEVVEIHQETLDARNSTRLTAEISLAEALADEQRTKRAIEMLEQALVVIINEYDEDDLTRPDIELSLARAYTQDRQPQKALKTLEKAGLLHELPCNFNRKAINRREQLAIIYGQLGRNIEAIVLLEDVVAKVDKEEPTHQTLGMASHYELAVMYRKEGRLNEAEEMINRVLKFRQYSLQEDHNDLLAAQNELALIHWNAGRIEQALTVLEKVVEHRRRKEREDGRNRLASEQNLGRIYLQHGRVDEAVQMLEKVVSVTRNRLAETDSHRLASECYLAGAYQAAERNEEAIEILEHVVSSGRCLDEGDPIRLDREYHLARIYMDTERYDRAKEILEMIVPIRRTALDQDDPVRLDTEHELGVAYLNLGRYHDAIEVLQVLGPIRKRPFSENRPSRLCWEHNLATAYLNLDIQNEVAFEILKAVVAARTQDLDENDRRRYIAEHDLGRAFYNRKDYTKATTLLEGVHRIRSRLEREEDRGRLGVQYMLGLVYRKTGRHRESIDILTKVMEVQEKTGANSLHTCYELGRSYLEIKGHHEAAELFEKVIVIMEGIEPVDYTGLWFAKYDLARAYSDTARVPESIKILQELRIVGKGLPAYDHNTMLVKQDLGKAYMAIGRYNAAIELLKDVLDYRMNLLEEDDPARIGVHALLVEAHLAVKHYPEAIALLEESQAESLPDDHIATLWRLDKLGLAYFQSGRFKEAVQALNNVVAVADGPGQDGSDWLGTRYFLAQAYHRLSQWENAYKVSAKRSELLSRKMAGDDPVLVAAYHDLGEIAIRTFRSSEAITILEKVLNSRAKLEDKDPDKLATEYLLSLAYLQANRPMKAIELLERVMIIRRDSAEADLERLSTEHSLAEAYWSAGRYSEALNLGERVVKIHRRVLDESHPDRLNSEFLLASGYIVMKRFDEGFGLLLKVAEIRRELYAGSHPARVMAEKQLDWALEELRKASIEE